MSEREQVVEISTPLVIVNFKTYIEATGQKALDLALIMQEVSHETGVTMIPVVQLVDLRLISGAVNIPVFVQHVDGVLPGSSTGKVLAEAVKDAGGVGTLLNHSEFRLDVSDIEKSLNVCKKNGLITVLCSETAEEGERLVKLDPDFIAVEPPELIGGDVSVTSANPNLITDAVKAIGKGRVLVGAGVKTGEDVRLGKELGAVGILVASGVCKSTDQKSVLLDFARNLL